MKVKNNKLLKTSIVLASFNGSQFIEEQLVSIHNQTQTVDEVLIFDDKSTDNTVEICKKFIKKYKLDNWSITINQNQLGVFQNFINGACSASGDIIFFSDQDDIWLDHKVETMTEFFSINQYILSLTTTFSRFDGENFLNQHVTHPNRKNNSLKKINLHDFCNFPYYLGMSMAISKDIIKKINFEYFFSITEKRIDFVHDIFFNFIATVNDGHYHLDKVLTNRRSYSQSVSNLKYSNELLGFNNNQRVYSIHDKLKKLNSFKLISTVLKDEISENQLRILDDLIYFFDFRLSYLKNRSFINWIKGLYKFHNFKEILADGYYLIKHKSYEKNNF